MARRLHDKTGLNVIHLDSFYHQPNWTEPPKEQWVKTVEKLIKGDNWIIDGNYGGTMEIRMERCDTVIWLDFPRTICTWRVLKRFLKNRDRVRPDMAEGCVERFEWEFIKYVWSFPREKQPGIEARVNKFSELKTYRLKSNREVENFLENISK